MLSIYSPFLDDPARISFLEFSHVYASYGEDLEIFNLIRREFVAAVR